MPLTFPTLAEKTLAAWQQAEGTNSINKFATAAGAFRDDSFGIIEWVFDDDSRLIVTGRGSNHKVTAELP